MPRLAEIVTVAGLTVAATVPAATSSAAPEGDPDRGRVVYRTGETVDGEAIMAVLGGNVEIPASTVPCASCHGREGRGRPEGGVVPTDLTWPSLTKPYGVTHASGRRHPPYDRRSLAMAITAGLDPAGTPLGATMPRYRMPRAAMDDLIAYLRVIDDERDPGIGPDTLRVGTVFPRDAASAVTAALTETLEALFAEIGADQSDTGGIYGRRLELVTLPSARTADAMDAVLDEADVVALVAPILPSDASLLVDLAETRRIPIIGPLTLAPGHRILPGHHTFYFYGGLVDQAEVLAAFAETRSRERATLSILAEDPDVDRALRRRIDSRLGVELVAGASLATDADFALCLDSASLARAAAVASRGWGGTVLVPAAAIDLDHLASFEALDNRLLVAFPHPIGPAARDGMARLAAWSADRGLGDDHRVVRGAVLAAGRLFVDAIERGGRDLSRAKLIRALESVRGFETGTLPPLTFDANRRIGLRGASILVLRGGSLQPIHGWFALDDSR